MDIGLAHDYLLVMRGAERSFAALADEWPQAPIYTTLYDEAGTDRRFAGRDVRTSPLQRFGVRQRNFRALLPLFPWAVRRLDARRHDVILSSSSAWAQGIRQSPDAVHVCYCYTPFRYAWHERATALREVPPLTRPALDGLLAGLKAWDIRSHRQVTHHVAISELTRRRIHEAYGVDSTIVYPPVEVERFTPAKPEDFVLIVGELVSHKRVHVALEAAERAGLPAKVVGDGPEAERWRARFASAEFVGRLDDEALAALYPRALALVMPNVEEFGITAVEAQAAGRPVVANAAGGALETVLDGKTGVLVPDAQVDSLAEALRETDFTRFSPEACRRNAERFSAAEFRRRMREVVERVAG
jgi:glycosyltransferase involved in cell wall biosynthesis